MYVPVEIGHIGRTMQQLQQVNVLVVTIESLYSVQAKIYF